MKYNELILLKIIDYNSSISPLLKLGYTYSQIVSMIQAQIDEGNIIIDGYYYKLTIKGKAYLREGLTNAGLHGKDCWLLPQKQYYHKPINKNEIVIPKTL